MNSLRLTRLTKVKIGTVCAAVTDATNRHHTTGVALAASVDTSIASLRWQLIRVVPPLVIVVLLHALLAFRRGLWRRQICILCVFIADNVLFAWSWFNKIGNREMYMNCAHVTIAGGRSLAKRSPADPFGSRPSMFAANVGRGCGTTEGCDLKFPKPGPDVDTASSKLCGPAVALSAVPCTGLAPPKSITLDVPATQPQNAAVVPKDFVGFGIESAFLPNFDNEFSANLVSSLASRMGKPPVVRVGGTSGDRFQYSPTQKEAKVCLKPPCKSSGGTFLLGPSFFESYERFKDARTVIQAPLENPINVTNTLDFVRLAWKHLDNGKRVATIALGNEVEYIYKKDAASYVNAALSLQSSIVKNLNLSGNAAKIFEAGNIASGSLSRGDSYHIDDVLRAGIDKNGLISTTAEHWYQISGKHEWTDATMQSLMTNHSAIKERFNSYTPSLKASQQKGIPYAIDENAAVLGGAPITFGGGFGYTLWSVDFNLLAMSRGVARVNNLAARPSATRSFWCPDNTGGKDSPGPQVRAPYPAAIFMADFIGKNASTAVTEVDTGRELLSAYAVYDDASKKLQRMALVNFRMYNGTRAANPRGEVTFNIPVGKGTKSVTVRRLRSDLGVAGMGFDYAGPKGNVSWAGEQWSHAIDLGKGHLTTGKVEESIVQARNGVVAVQVPNSEVAMVIL
ncbi:hypothetical protein NLG97_g3435 [Lecanicillium saksenae]|uniref:Uncharacterized protein n=1 Tax=Lecanicillium saksenae TaxID=468837 RepID=A0ACC1QZU1_9HYPO|nr:hypothetical protein NLG97_g3435 [Lecanicillium saksenae]